MVTKFLYPVSSGFVSALLAGIILNGKVSVIIKAMGVQDINTHNFQVIDIMFIVGILVFIGTYLYMKLNEINQFVDIHQYSSNIFYY